MSKTNKLRKIGNIMTLIAEILLLICVFVFIFKGQVIESCISLTLLYVTMIDKELRELHNNQTQILESMELQRKHIKEIQSKKEK